MKNTWQQLKPHYQLKIRKAAHRFNTAKRLKYTLMASDGWYDLRLDTIRAVSYTHLTLPTKRIV